MGIEAVQAKMLSHVLSRCRKGCRGSRNCAQYAALLLEYRAFLRGETVENDPTCTCGDLASVHHNGHGACSALKTATQLCGCPSFKLAYKPVPKAEPKYEPEPEEEA